jgi:RNA polymerase sigma-70 factor (ECF subfamily)
MNDAANRVSDNTLVEMVLKGNRDAYGQIMQRYGADVTRLISGKVPDDRVEELLQEAFIRAYKSLPGYSRKSPLKNWLAGIAVRTCYDYWRAAYRNREIGMSSLNREHLDWLANTPADEPGVPEKFETEMVREILDNALRQLSAKDRMVLTLTYLDGYSTAEAARLLGWSRSNVKVRSLRARRALRKFLEKNLDKGVP